MNVGVRKVSRMSRPLLNLGGGRRQFVTAQLILQAGAGIQGSPLWSMRRTANAEWPCLLAVER